MHADLAVGQAAVVAVALVTGMLTLLAVGRVWPAFWSPSSGELTCRWPPSLAVLPVAVLVGLVVAAGLAAEPLVVLSGAASAQILDRVHDLRAVLGGGA